MRPLKFCLEALRGVSWVNQGGLTPEDTPVFRPLVLTPASFQLVFVFLLLCPPPFPSSAFSWSICRLSMSINHSVQPP